MNGSHANRHYKYKRNTLTNLDELTSIMTRRHEEMPQCWADLDQGWEDLRGKMSEIGLPTNSSIAPETILG